MSFLADLEPTDPTVSVFLREAILCVEGSGISQSVGRQLMAIMCGLVFGWYLAWMFNFQMKLME